jgi:hypothetical protein
VQAKAMGVTPQILEEIPLAEDLLNTFKDNVEE